MAQKKPTKVVKVATSKPKLPMLPYTRINYILMASGFVLIVIGFMLMAGGKQQGATFNFDEMDRIPYMAPGLVGPEKAAKGKTPTDCWWHTIVPTNSKERQGYPTQKPLGILNRIIKVHTKHGDIVMDFFAGTGTTAVAAAMNGRKYVAIDSNPEAIAIIKNRIAEIP